MSRPVWKTLLQQLRRLARPVDGGLTDGQLLLRWLTNRDEAAFELIVWRHGPTVFGVCQRLLRRSQDIEDAFQATFLVFLRKAGTIGKREAVASWLYKVAYRVALQVLQQSCRQERLDGREAAIPAPLAVDETAWRDLRPVLDEEIERLPWRYRTVFVLCYLQGRTNEEAARELGVPVGTIQSRLARARAQLRTRLTRRGVTLTEGAFALGWAADASANMPVSLVSTTVKAALLGATEKAAAAGVVTAQATALAKGALHAMFLTKMKVIAALALTVALLGGGTTFTYRALAFGSGKGPSQAIRADESTRQGKRADRRKEDQIRTLPPGSQKPLSVRQLLAENHELIREVKELREKLAQAQIKHQVRLALWMKELEAKAPRAPVLPGTTTTTSTTSAAIPTAAVQDAEDALEILKAQLAVKKAELQGAMVQLHAAQRSAARISQLGRQNAVSKEVIIAEEEKVAKQQAAVQVKEAELHEQEVRIQLAARRLKRLMEQEAEFKEQEAHNRQGGRPLERLPGKTSSPRNALPTADQQLKEIRKDLEQLLKKIDRLERRKQPRAPDAGLPGR